MSVVFTAHVTRVVAAGFEDNLIFWLIVGVGVVKTPPIRFISAAIVIADLFEADFVVRGGLGAVCAAITGLVAACRVIG